MEKVQRDAIGVVVEVTIKEDGAIVDISTVTTKQLILKSPSGSASTKAADFSSDGTDGKLKYTTVAGDLDRCGIWKVQGYVVFPGGFDGRSDTQSFEVDRNL